MALQLHIHIKTACFRCNFVHWRSVCWSCHPAHRFSKLLQLWQRDVQLFQPVPRVVVVECNVSLNEFLQLPVHFGLLSLTKFANAAQSTCSRLHIIVHGFQGRDPICAGTLLVHARPRVKGWKRRPEPRQLLTERVGRQHCPSRLQQQTLCRTT